MTPTVNLLKLMNACQFALDKACTKKAAFKGDAINWGDLNCTDAIQFVSVHGDVGTRVTISECSPEGSYKLRKFVAEELTAAGFPECEVEAEW